MAKPNPLAQALSKQSVKKVASVAEPMVAVVPVPTAPGRTLSPSREGRVLVGGHFAPEVQTALKIMAAQERTTIQMLLAEAINGLFAKRHMPQIAELSGGARGGE